MKLVIDSGNTRCKLALFDKNKIKKLLLAEKLTVEAINEFCSNEKVEAAILSSVTRTDASVTDHLRKSFFFIGMNNFVELPITNVYETPETLGNDRLACAVAATATFPDKPVLSVDAGTCIKYDFVTAKGEYLGGAISPGLNMRLRSLHTFTARLPLVELKNPGNLTGKTTNESILSGAINGAIAEVNDIISQYSEKYRDLKVILTGGDMEYFEIRLKNRIFAVPELVLQGLNLILDYNAGKK
jgi:type III pantothenate kinase